MGAHQAEQGRCLGMQNAFNLPSNQNQQSLTSAQGCNTDGEVNMDGDEDLESYVSVGLQ